MTAVIQVNEQYAEQFQELIHSLPKGAVKLTHIKISERFRGSIGFYSFR